MVLTWPLRTPVATAATSPAVGWPFASKSIAKPPGAAVMWTPAGPGAAPWPMRLKSAETFIGSVGSIMTPMVAPGRTIGM